LGEVGTVASIAERQAKRAEAAAIAGSSAGGSGSQPDGLDDVAALLAEQLAACHEAASRCFAMAGDAEDLELPARLDAMKLAARLVQASAAAASAVKRLKGGEFHHHVTVARVDYAAEKASMAARAEAAELQDSSDLEARIEARMEARVAGAREKLAAKLDRIAQARQEVTPEQRAAAMEDFIQGTDGRSRRGGTP
jgi:hypothetical protein